MFNGWEQTDEGSSGVGCRLAEWGYMGGEDGEKEATDPVSCVSLKTCPSSLGTGTIALISNKFNLDLLLYKAFVVC